MNKKRILVLLSTILILIFVVGCTTNDKNNNNVQKNTENQVKDVEDKNVEGEDSADDTVVDEDKNLDNNNNNDYIKLREAKNIALKEVNNRDGVIVDYELEGVQGNYTYHEFEIQLDNEKHEIKIDTKTGDVIKTESKQNNHKIEEYNKYIGFDKAIKVATDNMRDKDDVITNLDLENHNKENIKAYYEIDIDTKGGNYEIKIDAESGEIVSED